MGKLEAALRGEIIRLARREAHTAVKHLGAAVKKLRTQTAALRQELAVLESRKAVPAPGGVSITEADREKARFSAGLMRKLRQRLGLSRPQCARLVGVSPFAIVAWEAGSCRPSARNLSAVIALRKLSKRSIKQLLDAGKTVL